MRPALGMDGKILSAMLLLLGIMSETPGRMAMSEWFYSLRIVLFDYYLRQLGKD